MKKTTTIIGKVLLAIVSVMLLMSFWGKISGSEMALGMYETLNLSKYRIILAIVQLLGIIMLWVPSCRKKGVLLTTGYLGGAIMAETLMTGVGLRAGITLIVLWVASALIDCGCGCKGACTCKGTDCKACKDGVCEDHK